MTPDQLRAAAEGIVKAFEAVAVDDPLRQAILAVARAYLAEHPSDGVLKLYKKAAHEQGELFCWCVQNLERFPPIEGDWIDELKRRLTAKEQA